MQEEAVKNLEERTKGRDNMNWLKGLLSALIGGAANGITLMIADPTAFNLNTGLRQLLTVCITSGLLSAAFYIKQSPLAKPEDKCIK